MSKLRVIFHVNETLKWDVALANITNLLRDVGDSGAEVLVLSNGPSVEAYADGEKMKKIEELAGHGVKFLACRNSLKNLCASGTLCLNEENLPVFIGVVPAGVTELIRRQAEGFAYIKP
ncbi:MAG: DsrE family protein [Nitrospirota bacterium]|nr:DsrE family protein [Nitrospirota bacterium]